MMISQETRNWQQKRIKKKRLRRMAPEHRALYNDIVRLRNEIGQIDFSVVEAIRELRNDAVG